MSKTKLMLDVAQDLHSLAESIQTLCDAMTAAPEDAPKPAAPQETISQATVSPDLTETDVPSEAAKLDLVSFRKRVSDYSTPENRPKIREILNRFGVRKITELEEGQYADVLTEIEKACETA